MVTFVEYLLEYVKNKDNALFFGIAKMKHGNNGKDYNRANQRINTNTAPKEFNHKNTLVDSVCRGTANNIRVAGHKLLELLQSYDTTFSIGIKTLGNSNAEIEMLVDNQGRQFGILRKKK